MANKVYPSSASVAYGTTTGSESITLGGDLYDVQRPKRQRDSSKRTHLASTAQTNESAAGWIKPDMLTLTFYWNKTIEASVQTLFKAGTTLAWKVTGPLEGSDTVGSIYRTSGWIESIEQTKLEAENSDPVYLNVGIQCTGDDTFTAAS